MIVVIGALAWRAADPAGPAGRACAVALAAAAAGGRVELAGLVGEDAPGDAVLYALTRGGVGHAAVGRDPSRPTPIAAPSRDSGSDADVEDDDSPFADPPARAAADATPRLPLDAADVTLALRYLDPSGVLVVTDDVPADALDAAVEGGEFGGLQVVVLVADAGAAAKSLPPDATILVVPDGDASELGAFETLVGVYAAALDRGTAPREAFAIASGASGWESVADAV